MLKGADGTVGAGQVRNKDRFARICLCTSYCDRWRPSATLLTSHRQSSSAVDKAETNMLLCVADASGPCSQWTDHPTGAVDASLATPNTRHKYTISTRHTACRMLDATKLIWDTPRSGDGTGSSKAPIPREDRSLRPSSAATAPPTSQAFMTKQARHYFDTLFSMDTSR